MSEGMVKLGLIGLGSRGFELLRTATEHEEVDLAAVCDLDPERLALAQRREPRVTATTRAQDLLDDDSLDAILVASPTGTHYELALATLRVAKHVFVDGSIAPTSEQSRELIACAAERDLVLMPGHTYLYAPPVVAVKDMLDRQALGEIYFVTATRVSLGIHRPGSNVIQDLAPDDFSILQYWLGPPLFVRAIGRDSIVPGEWDVCFIDVGYPTGTLVRVELSWLAPSKLRRTVVAGRQGMVVYDEQSHEPIRLYDCSVEVVGGGQLGAPQMNYRTGDIVAPRVAADEPLRLELAAFAEAVLTGEQPRSNMHLGLEVVRMLEAAELSLHHSGSAIPLNLPAGEQRRQPDRRRSDHGMPWFDGPTVATASVPVTPVSLDDDPSAAA